MNARMLLVAAVFSFCFLMPIRAFPHRWLPTDLFARTSQIFDMRGSRQSLIVFERNKNFWILGAEKKQSNWEMVLGPYEVSIGKSGMANPGEKMEGDGKTPSGLFDLKLAFGYKKPRRLKMPYLQVSEEDIWVDDPNSPDYNRLMKIGETAAKSFEYMRRRDSVYSHGIVIEYNTKPVVRNLGSAIFVHVWSGRKIATSGCVALGEKNLLRILKWLDPDKTPTILLGFDPLRGQIR